MTSSGSSDSTKLRADLAALATRASKGDELAFEEIHERLNTGVRAFLRVHGYRAEEGELAQETWIDVWRALVRGRYDPERAALTTFVYAVAWKTLLRHRRRQGRRSRATPRDDLAEYVEELMSDDPEPSSLLELCGRVEALIACLALARGPLGLQREEHLVIKGVFFESRSERSLSGELDLAPSVIHTRKASALSKLGRCMKGKGYGQD